MHPQQEGQLEEGKKRERQKDKTTRTINDNDSLNLLRKYQRHKRQRYDFETMAMVSGMESRILQWLYTRRGVLFILLLPTHLIAYLLVKFDNFVYLDLSGSLFAFTPQIITLSSSNL
jgi:hypothetical protein